MIVLTPLVGTLAFKPLSNYYGYCLAEGKFLSNEEKIDAAINYINSRDRVPIISGNEIQYLVQIRYSSVSDFKAKNPDCCQVGMSGFYSETWPPTFKERVEGRYGDRVKVKFQLNYIDKNGVSSSKPEEWDYVIENCGGIR